MTLTTTSPTGSASTTAVGGDSVDKDWTDFLGGVLPDVAGAVAPSLGLDPRAAGQAVSQVLNMFGIGGSKGFRPTIAKDQALSQMRAVISPYLGDPTFNTALRQWLQAAVEPIQALQGGKEYRPPEKNFFDTVGNAISHVPWNDVAKIGLQALPYIAAAIA